MKKNIWICFLWMPMLIHGQESLSLDDLSYFKPTGKKNWQLASDLSTSLTSKDSFQITPGVGVLVNLPSANEKSNLHSVKEYGDVDVSFDFMMFPSSNSGFYLQGRYEVQLLDSWGVLSPTSADCGGIYKRFGQKPNFETYEGHAPRINACLAPGLWQQMEISFQAPRFDANGTKISNAKIIYIKLNGATIQENVSLSGPTGGSISEMEASKGPFVIQGDHGAVAFRNFNITDLSSEPVSLGPINYSVFLGEFSKKEDLISKKPDLLGTTDKLTWNLSPYTSNYANILKSDLIVPQAGKYQVDVEINGRYSVKINGNEVFSEPLEERNYRKTIQLDLPAGKIPLEIIQIKSKKNIDNKLAFWIKGSNFRTVAFHSKGSYLENANNEDISLDANTPQVFRSFMDLYQGKKRIKRVVHAVNVGSPNKIHYTYDLDNANIVQVWKGNFLNTTPMWDDRGDGSSRPLGPVLTLSPYSFLVSKSDLFTEENKNEKITIKGYELDNADIPTFLYALDGSEFSDKSEVIQKKHLQRTIQIKNPNGSHLLRIAVGSKIQKNGENKYVVDGKKYYIEAKGATIETSDKMQVLAVPASEKVQYSIIW